MSINREGENTGDLAEDFAVNSEGSAQEKRELSQERVHIEREYENDITLIPDAVEKLDQKLTELGWDSTSVFHLTLALDELTANAILHGNFDLPSIKDKDELMEEYAKLKNAESKLKETEKKKVRVTIDASPTEIALRVEDEGRGYIPDDQDNPLSDEEIDKRMEDALAKGETTGRGYLILRKFFKQNMKFSRGAKGGTLVTIEHKQPQQ